MRAFEWERALSVRAAVEVRRSERERGMTRRATLASRARATRRKAASVGVVMAGHAGGRAGPDAHARTAERRCFCTAGVGARVAALARHGRVRAEQRIARARVFCPRPRRGPECLHDVTGGAVHRGALHGRGAAMRVGVAVHAAREPRFRAASRRGMAVITAHGRVCAAERIASLVVVEAALVHRAPAGRRVTARALPGEASGVRVAVARDTVGVRHWTPARAERAARVRPLVHGRRRVAAGAGGLRVRAGERIPRACVVEAWRRTPPALVVAGQAVTSERAAMRVRVTAHAVRLQAEPAPRVVLHLQQRHRLRALERGLVAVAAGERRVLALEHPAGLRVREAFRAAALPGDEREVAPAVVGMTGRARLCRDARVESTLVGPHPAHLAVAGQAAHVHLRLRLAARVAAETVGGTVQGRVRLGEWARRDLGANGCRGEHGAGEQQGREEAAHTLSPPVVRPGPVRR